VRGFICVQIWIKTNWLSIRMEQAMMFEIFKMAANIILFASLNKNDL
jgi:hypothetical protein